MALDLFAFADSDKSNDRGVISCSNFKSPCFVSCKFPNIIGLQLLELGDALYIGIIELQEP